MEDASDIINTVKATLYERISNPLISTFIVSWLIWNYKFILVFFSSSLNTIQKIDYIKSDIFHFTLSPFFTLSNASTILVALVAPILTSLFYLYVIYPRWGKRVYETHKEHIKEYIDIKVKIDGETSMSEEDVRALKAKLRNIENINSKQIDLKENEIQILRTDLDNATDDAAKSRTQLSEIQGKQLNYDKMEEQLSKLKKTNEQKEETIQRMKIDDVSTKEELKTLREALDKTTSLGNNPFDMIKVPEEKLSDDATGILKFISYDPSWQSISRLRDNFEIHRLRYNKIIKLLIDEEYVDIDAQNNIKINSKGEKYLLDNDLI